MNMPIECLAYNHVQSNTQTKTNFWSNQPNSLIVIHTPTHNLYIIIHSMQYCVIYPFHVIDGRSVWCPQRPWIDAALPCIVVQQDVVFFGRSLLVQRLYKMAVELLQNHNNCSILRNNNFQDRKLEFYSAGTYIQLLTS